MRINDLDLEQTPEQSLTKELADEENSNRKEKIDGRTETRFVLLGRFSFLRTCPQLSVSGHWSLCHCVTVSGHWSLCHCEWSLVTYITPSLFLLLPPPCPRCNSPDLLKSQMSKVISCRVQCWRSQARAEAGLPELHHGSQRSGVRGVRGPGWPAQLLRSNLLQVLQGFLQEVSRL